MGNHVNFVTLGWPPASKSGGHPTGEGSHLRGKGVQPLDDGGENTVGGGPNRGWTGGNWVDKVQKMVV